MLDSSCANACALNGLPGPMRHWFTGFTQSLTHSRPWHGILHDLNVQISIFVGKAGLKPYSLAC